MEFKYKGGALHPEGGAILAIVASNSERFRSFLQTFLGHREALCRKDKVKTVNFINGFPIIDRIVDNMVSNIPMTLNPDFRPS